MAVKRKKERFIEIMAGFFLILSILSFLIAYLFSFDFSVPGADFNDDLDFMMDSALRLRNSSILWTISGIINIIYVPIYLAFFYRFQKGLHILNSLLIMVVGYSFFNLGINELNIARIAELQGSNGGEITQDTDLLLNLMHRIILFTKIGITSFGAFSTIFSIGKFGNLKFPVFGSTITFLAGPIVITFIWMNPGHILMTTGLAILWTGLLIIGVKLVNWGLKDTSLPGH